MPKKIDPSEIKLLEEIGDGSYAVVHKGIFRGEFVAIKKFDGSCPISSKKQLENEIQILGKLSHHNIVKLLGYCDQRNNNFLALEYLDGGSLFDLLISEEKNINSCKLVQDISNGMEYLHSNSILHLDLKSSNIILSKDKDKAKITDFGISKISTLTTMISANIRTKSARGTFRWMAPEISNGFPGTRSSDVWSFGCVLIEIMTRKLPFFCLSDQQLLTILQDQKSDLPINTKNFSKILAEIVCECLKKEPNERPMFNYLKVFFSKCTQNDFDLKEIDQKTNSLKTSIDLNKFIENVKNYELEQKKDKEIQELKKKLNEKEKDICSINNNLAELTKKFNELAIKNQNIDFYHKIRQLDWNSATSLSPPETPTNIFSKIRQPCHSPCYPSNKSTPDSQWNYLSQDRSSYYTPSYSLIKTPPETSPNYIPQNRSSCSTPIDTIFKHSGRDTGHTYVSRGSANGRIIYEGPRGGTYYLTPSGNKVYIKLN